MSADLALQKAIRARLTNSTEIVGLVPAASILDRHARPAPDPSIILGEGQTLEGDDLARLQQRVVLDLHVWKKEPSLAGVKAIAGAVRTALHSGRLALDAGFHCGDCRVSHMRFLRDQDGETSHAVVTVEALVSEVV
ncbi:DUF3168 domain-containing protein [Blastochloris viridis]|uniref:DUF3168 domain-containing protein n=1 Tax=Blastochloris viridis TaxID=1079 RepID=A0A0H5BEH0_BLAVI|nr:DUF3168 domain-containing protein [Blastochloris viridis]ALK09503.1 hypothetical protein BVIR_1727 [Blastochloris viridis]BAS00613.1 hypothetical protein BV133_3019 [Blastochloris viridis]CUU42166.1 hypothetical protein BVIRIDIS_11720 [Blastochloris viridis]